MKKRNNTFVYILAWIFVCLAVGYTSSFFTTTEITSWYATLTKPFFSPPNWIFFPVWTTLYVLMGIAAGIIWSQRAKKGANIAILWFVFQLILNFFWSYIFFGLHQTWLAFFEIILLWITILMSILTFGKVSKNASYLLWPYILWVSFASILNLAIALLN